MKSNFMKVNNINLHYLENKVDESSPTILALHGAAESCEAFSELMENFKNYNLLFLDLCGHGKSEGDAKEDIYEYGELVTEFINKIDYKDIILMGHSMGSIISILLGIQGNCKIKKIILLGSTPKISMPDNINEIIGTYDALKSLVMNMANTKDANFVGDRFYDLFNCSDENRKRDFKAVSNIDFISQLNKISVPVLIVCGDRDFFMSLDMQLELKKQIPNSELCILPGRNHLFLMEPSIIPVVRTIIEDFI